MTPKKRKTQQKGKQAPKRFIAMKHYIEPPTVEEVKEASERYAAQAASGWRSSPPVEIPKGKGNYWLEIAMLFIGLSLIFTGFMTLAHHTLPQEVPQQTAYLPQVQPTVAPVIQAKKAHHFKKRKDFRQHHAKPLTQTPETLSPYKDFPDADFQAGYVQGLKDCKKQKP